MTVHLRREGAKLNRTQVFNLRKTPKGYEGRTTLYDGTRIIKLPESTPNHASETERSVGHTRGHGKQQPSQPAQRGTQPQRTNSESRTRQNDPRHSAAPTEPRRVLSGAMTETGRLSEGAPTGISGIHGAAGASGERYREATGRQDGRQTMGHSDGRMPERRTDGSTEKSEKKKKKNKKKKNRQAARSTQQSRENRQSSPVQQRRPAPQDGRAEHLPKPDRPYQANAPREYAPGRADMSGTTGYGASERSARGYGVPNYGAHGSAAHGYGTQGYDTSNYSAHGSAAHGYGTQGYGTSNYGVPNNAAYGQNNGMHGGAQPSGAQRRRKRPPMSEEDRRRLEAAEQARRQAEQEMERQRAERRAEQRRKRAIDRKRRRRAALRFIVSELVRGILRGIPWLFALVGMTVLLGAVSGGIIFVDLHLGSSTHPETVEYLLTDPDDNKVSAREMAYNGAFFSGTPYIKMSDLASDFDLTVAGDGKRYKLITQDGNIIKLTIGSSVLVLGGDEIRLSAPIFERGGEIYIPIELLDDYLTGVSADYTVDEKKKIGRITITREIEDYTVSVAEGKQPVYAGLGFIYNISPDASNIAEDSLPEAIAAATDPNPPPAENGNATP